MRSSKELTEMFFSDLKRYNNSNFKAIAEADVSNQDPVVHKAFSAVITRYFIFREKHPEVTEQEHKILYFKLKLDMIATYFSEFPDTSTDNLVAFQLELKKYLKECKHRGGDINDAAPKQESPLPDIKLESDNTMPVQQQPEPVPVP